MTNNKMRTKMKTSKTIKLFLEDGCPNGLFTIEIMNWTGQLHVTPRIKVSSLIKRSDVRKTGIYFLFGTHSKFPAQTMLYVGESDDVGKRINQHNQNDEQIFWDKACAITSKDQNLTKAHVKYLESKIISLILQSKQIIMFNKNTPKFEGLPISDISDMNLFLDHIFTVLPLLNIHFVQPNNSDVSHIPFIAPENLCEQSIHHSQNHTSHLL